MPSTYSPSLRIELPGSGEQSGVWGTTTNNNLGTLLEQSIAGVQAITMTDANYTLSNYNGVSDEARKAVLVVSGTNTAVRDIIAPLVTKVYTIKNNTTGGYAINIRAPSGSSVSIPNGVTSSVYCDGTNFNLALTQTLVAAGTGISVGVVGATNTISFGPITSAQLATALTDETGTGANVFATSPTLVTPVLGTPTSGTLSSCTGLPISTGVSGLGTNVATFLTTPTSANLAAALTDETGTGANVFATSPTLVTPNLGTPTTLVGTNITGTASGLTAGTVTTNANLTGAVTSVGNATSLGSFTSAQLATAVSDETGSGAAVFATSPTLVSPNLGTPTTLVGTNITGTAASLTAGNATTLNGTWNQMPAGTRVPFAQAAAPTGWTQDITDNANNRMLRVVNTTGNDVGGSDSPIVNSTTMVAHTHTFTGNSLAPHSHTDSGHSHGIPANAVAHGTPGGGTPLWDSNNPTANTYTSYANISSVSAGTTSGSNSTTTGVSWTPRYIDMIICSKN